MGPHNPPLDAVRRSVWVAALVATLTAAGCIVSPLDDITPSTETQPTTGVKRMDAGSDVDDARDAAAADASGPEPDAEPAETKDAGSPDSEPSSNNAGRAAGGRAGAGGRGGSSGAAAGSGGAPAAGAAGSQTMSPIAANEAIEDVTRQYFERINQRTSVSCDCQQAAVDEATCRWSMPRKPHVECMTSAFQRVGASTIEPLQCASDVEQEWRECFEQTACVQESFGACNSTHIAERRACNLPPDMFVDRCLGVYNGLTGVDGFMQRAAGFVEQICFCNPDGTTDPTPACADNWYAETSGKTADCVADIAYGIEARSTDQDDSPAVALLQCVSAGLGGYLQCMNELTVACDPAGQQQCSDSFTTFLGDECGAQGVSLFTCISPM